MLIETVVLLVANELISIPVSAKSHLVVDECGGGGLINDDFCDDESATTIANGNNPHVQPCSIYGTIFFVSKISM